MLKELDYKEKLFVSAYLATMDPCAAALEAGYSKSMANSKAYQWVSDGKRKPHVYQAIVEANAKMCEKFEITSEKVLSEIASLAFSNMQDYYAEDGSLKPVHELTREQASAIISVKVTDGIPTEYKFHDKGQNLERLGRNLKLFTDNIRLSGSLTLEQLVEGAQ